MVVPDTQGLSPGERLTIIGLWCLGIGGNLAIASSLNAENLSNMPYLIGTDEAGYGPNLGPLVVSATVWEVTEKKAAIDPYDLLVGLVSEKPSPRNQPKTITIADSKSLFSRSVGLRRLEGNVLAALALMGSEPKSWGALWEGLAPGIRQRMEQAPWYRDFECDLPISAASLDWIKEANLLEKIATRDIRLLDVRSAVALPSEFNREVRAAGSKGAVLSQMTLDLISEALGSLAKGPVSVHCDKHGGRNRYLPVLQTSFPDQPIRILQESRGISRYRWKRHGGPVDISFVAKGERYMPTALASMVSKYLRELAMTAFNTFWIEHCPGLRPTAGYPVDAKRFRQDIADVQSGLGIPDDALWRER